MGSNAFGNVFKITTFGESHGVGIGVVIDGCPPGLPLTEESFLVDMAARRPGGDLVSPRKEEDAVRILSGVFEGVTTGHPIALFIENQDIKPAHYSGDIFRPGHAHFTYLKKYGIFDHRGGGRASARETASRVAAGVVAKALLKTIGIEVAARLHSVGGLEDLSEIKALIETLKREGDSTGGVVSFEIVGAPAGLGDPVYEKLEARLAFAMMGLPASKGFEIGEGFGSTTQRGSEHNDGFATSEDEVVPKTNHAGGLLGGISTGAPIYGKVAFKPTSSIFLPQASATPSGDPATFQMPAAARHDPCVAIRAVPVVSAMCALVMADAYLMNRIIKMEKGVFMI